MNYSKTASEILKHVKKDPFDDQPRQDYFELCRAWFAEWEAASRKKMFHQYQITGATNKVGKYTEFNHPAQLHNRKDFRPLLTTALQRAVENRDWAAAERLDSMLFKSLLFGAPHFFEDYLNAVEYGKPYDKRFYAPRQHYLHRYTQAYQEVLEGKLHFLSFSMPKLAGKSQMGINFVNMLSGRKPNHSTLMEGTGDDLVQSFYKGCLEYLDAESEYHFYDIFPNAKLVQTYADRKKGAKLGIYSNMVKDNVARYMVPQECGAKEEVRWAKITDRKGRGMLFEMDRENGPMMFSALPYTPHEMENAMHPYELPEVHYTVVRVAKDQMGIAGDDSWGARTHEEYLLDVGKSMEFSFVFKGI